MNSIETKKFQYNEYEEDIIRATEYMFLNDPSFDQETYAIFKFYNSFEHAVKQLVFFVIQYDEDNELINRSRIKYDSFEVDGLKSFVPKVKLLLDKKCDHLEIYVDEASFDNHFLIDGVIQDINRDIVEEDEITEVKEEEYEIKEYVSLSNKAIMFAAALIVVLIGVASVYVYINYLA